MTQEQFSFEEFIRLNVKKILLTFILILLFCLSAYYEFLHFSDVGVFPLGSNMLFEIIFLFLTVIQLPIILLAILFTTLLKGEWFLHLYLVLCTFYSYFAACLIFYLIKIRKQR
jgi:hypothetical protein